MPVLNQKDIEVVGGGMGRSVSKRKFCAGYFFVLVMMFFLVRSEVSYGQLRGGAIERFKCVLSGGTATFSSIRDTSGGNGAGVVEWEKDNNPSFSNSPATIIPGASLMSYTDPSINATSYYRRRFTNGGTTVFSNVIKVTVVASTTAPQFNPTGVSPICQGDNTFNVSFNTGGTTPTNYSIIWATTPSSLGFTDVLDQPLSASPLIVTVPTNAPVNSYTGTLIATDANGCSTLGGTAPFTFNARPTINVFASLTAITTGMTTTLTATGSGSGAILYTWSPSTSLSATTGSTVTASPTSNITYTVTGTDNNCPNTATTAITVNPILSAGSIGTSQAVCINISASALTSLGDASNGTGTKLYQWQQSTNNISFTNISGATSNTYSPGVLSQTTYFRRGASTSVDATVYTNTVTITVNALPTVAPITGNNTVCVGSTISLSSATSAGVWSSGTTSVGTINGSGILTGVSSGTITISYTVTDNNGCVNAVSSVKTINPLPTVNAITGNNAVCAGSTISLSNTTPGGVWSSGTTSVGTINGTGVLTSISSGTTAISYTVTDNNGCINAVTSVKTINPLPTVNAITGNNAVCAGSSIILSDVTPGGVWSSGTISVATINGTGVLTGVSSGSTLISYTVTNNNGCVNSATSIKTVNPLPTLFINTPTICAPGTIDLTSPAIISIGSTANLSYTQWNNALATSALTNASAITATGVYYIKGTIAATSCAVTKAVTATINPQPTVVITTPSSICAPGTIDLTSPSITSAGSTANLSYTQWNNALTTSALTNASAITTTGIYYIKGTIAATGCAVTKAVTATINPLPTVVITAPTVCAPGTIDLTSPVITSAGSTANLSYTQWNNALATSVLTNANAITATGVYYIKGTLPATGCAVTKPVTATIVTAPILIITNPAAVCAPATVDLTSTAVTTGSTPGLTFSYFTNAANTNTLITPSAVNVSGTYYIKGTVGITGCASSQPVTVTINPLPNGVLQTPSVNYICNGLSLLLTASNANSYQWFYNKQPVSGAVTNTYAATNAGDYTVRFISSAGCVQDATNTITLSLLTKPILQFTDNGSCAGSPINFTNQSAFASSGNINWQWNFGNGSFASILSPVYIYPVGGDYIIALTANNLSCPNLTDSILVPYHIEAPRIPYRYATINAVRGVPTTLSSRNAGSVYLWKPATGLNDARLQFPTATLNNDVEYTITINSAAGCTVTDTVLVKVTNDGSLYVAQAFTPNGDGVNDRCYPITVGIRSLTYFKIFNRWGNVVFQTNDLTPQNGWDGKWNGKIQPPGTYQWVAEAIDGGGNIIKKTGSVLLVN